MTEEYTPDITAPKVEMPVGVPKAKVERMEVPDVVYGKEEVILSDDKPLALFGDSYLVEFLKLGQLYNDDIDDLKTKVAIVDKYIKVIILKRDYQPIVKSYKEVWEELKKKYEISNLQSGYSQIDKIWLRLKLSGIK